MALRDIILKYLMEEGSLLPPGLRFHPTDVELVLYFLKKKVMGKRLRFDAISEVDIYKFSPWELPEKSILGSGDLKWYFFCPLEKKYSKGARMNRATQCGFWKVTGNDRTVHDNGEVVGFTKTLIFHKGKAPGERTDWVLHEYRLEEKNLAERELVRNKYVLCVIFEKEGPGPRNCAQYGATFNEEDWDDGEEVACVESGASAGLSALTHMPCNYNSSVATGTSQLGGTVFESCLSETVPSRSEGLPSVRANNVILNESGDGHILSTVLVNNGVSKDLHKVFGDDDIPSMIDGLTEGNTLILNDDDKNKNLGHDVNDEAERSLDVFKDLEDLFNIAGPSEYGFNYPAVEEANQDYCLDLSDLDKPLPDSAALPP